VFQIKLIHKYILMLVSDQVQQLYQILTKSPQAEGVQFRKAESKHSNLYHMNQIRYESTKSENWPENNMRYKFI